MPRAELICLRHSAERSRSLHIALSAKLWRIRFPARRRIVQNQLIVSLLVQVMMNLVRNIGHDHPIQAAQRQREQQRAVLVERLLPERIHHQMPHDDVDEASRVSVPEVRGCNRAVVRQADDTVTE